MANKRTPNKDSKLVRAFKTFLHLGLLGAGIGVVVGTSLKTILLLEESNQIKLPNFFSSIFIPFESNERYQTVSQEINLLDLNGSNPQQEIQEISNSWKKSAIKQKDLEVSAYLLFLDDGTFAQYKSDSTLPAASSIKIHILLATLKMVEDGEIEWNEPLKLTKELVGGGAGWMAYQPIGTNFPVHEVATEMIRVSDNTATNLLIKRIGGIDSLNEKFKLFGLNNTEVRNLLPDLSGTNVTSAKDLAKSIALVDTGRILKLKTRDLFREVMSTSRTNRLLPGGLLKGMGINEEDPDFKLLVKGYRVYNKTGDIGIAYSDSGLIETPDNRRAVASFIVKGPFNDPRSAELIREMAASMVPVLEP